jgi:hypothetical protein
MTETLEAKAKLATEVAALRGMLAELCIQFSTQPRSAVATRQLKYILSKMDQWLATFGPKPEVDITDPTREEIDDALLAYREKGFRGLSARERFVIEWFDKEYRPGGRSFRIAAEPHAYERRAA